MSELVKSNNQVTLGNLGDLDLSDFKNLIAKAKKDNTSLALSEDFGGETESNKLWRAHVQTYLGKSPTITWTYPISNEEKKKLESQGLSLYEEVTPTVPEHQFVGLRGIILKVAYGRKFVLPKKGENNSFETICHTTALENEMKGKTITDRMPMEIPITHIHKDKNDPHSLNPWLNNRPYLKLYGSRPPVGVNDDVKTTKVRTCAECVAAGEHYQGTIDEFIDPKKNTPKCSMTGYMLFCVFQIGIVDSSQVLHGGKSQIKWVDVSDANLIKQMPNKQEVPRTGPFILKINGLGTSQHYSLGTGDYEHDIVTQGKNVYLPQGAPLYSWGDYLNKYLLAKNIQDETRALSLGDTTVYPVVTDLMLAKLRNAASYATHVPVYTPVLNDEVISRGENLTNFDWLQVALHCLQQEEALVQGDISNLKEIGLPGESIKSLPESPKVKKETTREPVASSTPKTSFAAFAPPPNVD